MTLWFYASKYAAISELFGQTHESDVKELFRLRSYDMLSI